MKKVITISEASRRLGVSIKTLRRWDKNGIFPSFRVSEKSHRYYFEQDIDLFGKDLFPLAEKWVQRKKGVEPESSLYCPTSDIFQSRLVHMQNALIKTENLSSPFSLIVAIAGEIGNNSFDHNLGNWRDLPGIFFGYNLKKGYIVLADRGQGILKTLQRVKPELQTHTEALQVAFTEIISGRAPESRGIGLKYVRKVVSAQALSLILETGDAQVFLQQGDQELSISEKIPGVHGCIALIQFHTS
ncbi:MerR family DNA-binding transcriptional regulator [Candidatus Peregrinibacteria bacterium]|nr:MerR family DNA-binding transcriptional regulator [Candidatus Peregrinibacteria bacterium]